MRHQTDLRLAAVVAALASMGAAFIHAAVIPDHWREWPASGLFFACLALFQFGWAVAVLRTSHRGVLLAGLAANVAALGLWALTRTSGLPFGPHAGEPESIGTAGLLTVVLEAVAVLTAGWAMLPRAHAAEFSPWRYRFALAGAALLVAAVMGPGVVAGLSHSHGGSGGHDHTGEHGEPGGTEPAPPPGSGAGSPPPDGPATPATTSSPHGTAPHGHSEGHSH
ncbi:hypothetical protein B0I33_102494 [Prauserella shujinwangii]|uniref:Uncharacterized protein n=1 Tax=Prauserella shujinwangii TaxID=1453103 RepID=A0A2T0M1B5_9PSEU|nr:hypothetical protein [Prauserella shujinwangii]PRX50373.1 hypothetical protein B0I33_102494 [Prauserella shujinwangii]